MNKCWLERSIQGSYDGEKKDEDKVQGTNRKGHGDSDGVEIKVKRK